MNNLCRVCLSEIEIELPQSSLDTLIDQQHTVSDLIQYCSGIQVIAIITLYVMIKICCIFLGTQRRWFAAALLWRLCLSFDLSM